MVSQADICQDLFPLEGTTTLLQVSGGITVSEREKDRYCSNTEQ
jgi:hypothetical protein